MSFSKITNTELASRGATTLPNQPTISATALKQEFDAPAKNIVAPKVNNLIDELEANTASESLGATAPTGRIGNTVQAVLNSISGDLATLESNTATAIADAHTHTNLALLETYTQTETDLASAVADDHTHSNKSLLDSYAQTETDLADAVSKKHDHTNKSLLDSYDQTNANITDAVNKKHDHSNKALLDTYDQTNANISDAVTKRHSHTNKALLDNYTQTEVDLADAVSKKHAHTNKSVLDDLSDNSGDLYYKGNPISGAGSVNDAFKNVTVGANTITASGEDTLTLAAGSNVTLSTSGKTVTIAATGGGGTGTGNMDTSDYCKLAITDTVDKAASLYDGTNTLTATIPEINSFKTGKADVSHTHGLSDLTDFAVSSPSNGQVMKYDSTSGKWMNANESGGSSITVYDDLTHTSGTDALSANQGYVLDNKKANETSSFTAASSRTNIASGDTVSTIFGKIAKWFTDLADLAFIAKDGVSSTKYLRGDGTWQTFPTIPTVNDATLTINQNGTAKATFTANSASAATANIVTDEYISGTGANDGVVQSDGTVSFHGIDDTPNYSSHTQGYEPHVWIDGNSTNLAPYAKLKTASGFGTNSLTLTYDTDADIGASVYLRVIK